MRREIIVIGSPDFTLGYRLAGIKRFINTPTQKDFNRSLESVMEDPSAGVVIVEGELYNNVPFYLKKATSSRAVPVFIPITKYGEGLEEYDMKALIKKALGVDVDL